MKRKKTTYKPFDRAAYLDNDEVIAEYLSAASEDPKPEVFLAALGEIKILTLKSTKRDFKGGAPCARR